MTAARLVPISIASPPRPTRVGQMRVKLNVHGGQRGLADVIEGLVQRNARAVREGAAAPYRDGVVGFDPSAKAWKDALTATVQGSASGKTMAAWYAGTLRAQGKPAVLGFHNGQPVVYVNGKAVRTFDGPGVGYLDLDEGRTDERMVLAIDDDEALPVQEINTAIARHNAKRIKAKNLPPLYRSGVRYQTEGSPELWWDAEEILRNGHDDCEGLAAYRAGELIARDGQDARVKARLIKVPSKEMGGTGKGGRLFHAVTALYGPDGQIKRDSRGVEMIDDPSARLGMPRPEWFIEYAAEKRKLGQDL